MTESPIKEASQDEGPKSPKKTMKGAFGISSKKFESAQNSPKGSPKSGKSSPKKKKGGGLLTVLKTKKAATLFIKSLKKIFAPSALMRFMKVKKIAGAWKPKPKPTVLAPKSLADVIKAQKMKRMGKTWKGAKKKFKTFTDLMGAIKVKSAVGE